MKSKRKRRLPPPSGTQRLQGLTIESYSVGSWCPTPDGSGPAEAVAIAINVRWNADVQAQFVMRLKSPEAVDAMIQSLLRHKRDVWPEAP